MLQIALDRQLRAGSMNSSGNEFQTVGPAIVAADHVLSRQRGTISCVGWWSADEDEKRLRRLEWDDQRSAFFTQEWRLVSRWWCLSTCQKSPKLYTPIWHYWYRSQNQWNLSLPSPPIIASGEGIVALGVRVCVSSKPRLHARRRRRR